MTSFLYASHAVWNNWAVVRAFLERANRPTAANKPARPFFHFFPVSSGGSTVKWDRKQAAVTGYTSCDRVCCMQPRITVRKNGEIRNSPPASKKQK